MNDLNSTEARPSKARIDSGRMIRTLGVFVSCYLVSVAMLHFNVDMTIDSFSRRLQSLSERISNKGKRGPNDAVDLSWFGREFDGGLMHQPRFTALFIAAGLYVVSRTVISRSRQSTVMRLLALGLVLVLTMTNIAGPYIAHFFERRREAFLFNLQELSLLAALITIIAWFNQSAEKTLNESNQHVLPGEKP